MFLRCGIIIQVVQKMLLLKRSWPYKNFITLFTSNSKFRLNLTQRVTGSLYHFQVDFSQTKFNFTQTKFNFTLTKFNFTLTKFNFTLAKFNFTLAKFNFTLAKFNFTLTKFNFTFLKINLKFSWNSYVAKLWAALLVQIAS